MANARYMCPVCGKHQGVRLLTGVISPEVLERFLGQSVVLGSRDEGQRQQPDAECLACGSQWRLAIREQAEEHH